MIITDSPAHGERYHTKEILDDYKDKDKEFDNLEETIRKLISMKIAIIGLILPNLNLVETTKEMY